MIHTPQITPPPTFRQVNLVPVVLKLKDVYGIWYKIYIVIPKIHRYTLAQKIDMLFIELIEMTVSASFVRKSEKITYLRVAIRKLDTIKILLLVLYETGSLQSKKYILLATPLEAIGKMLGGWLGQVEKQNSP